jgi:hypothetical protein
VEPRRLRLLVLDDLDPALAADPAVGRLPPFDAEVLPAFGPAPIGADPPITPSIELDPPCLGRRDR